MKIGYFWKPLLWLAIICYALFIPAKDIPLKPFLNIPYFDKIVHFSLFFVLCVLLFRPFKRIEMKYYFWAPFTSIIFGAVLELIQHTISISRSTNIYDFMANATGIIASVVFFYLFVSGRKLEKLF